MEKLVRVIKLQPGEAVVILAEDEPAPCPCCCACMMQRMLLFLTAFWCGWMKPHKEYPMCRVTILDENGIPVTVEVSREIYQVFVDYEREVERQRKADFRHRDARSWDTCLIFEVSTETLEQTYERIRTLHEIQEALNEFTPKQRRRFLLHFAYGYTYMEIAKMEGSNKSTVMRSAKVALKKIQKKLAA